jgi:Ca2+ transporting ATPase
MKRKKFFNSYQNPISFYKKDYITFFKNAFTDELLIDLIEGSIVGGIIGSVKEGIATGWNDSIIIMISVTLVAMFSAFSNYQKQNKFLHLFSEINNKNYIVKRNGELISINVNDLITGDIILVQEGDDINVNGILLKGKIKCRKIIYKNNKKENIKIDFSNDDDNFIINSNSYNPLEILSGEAEILVILISNKNADFNKIIKYNKDNIIYQYIKEEEIDGEYFEENNLNYKIHLLSEQIGNLGVIIGYMVGVVMIIKFFAYNYYLGNYTLMFNLMNIAEVLVDIYIITEALKVALIPEGLPIAMSLAISSNIDFMIKDKILINHINKINDITKMNYLILNKEILTENTMIIKEVYIFNKKIEMYDKNNLEKIFDDIVYNSISKVIILDGKKVINKNCKNNEADICIMNYYLENFEKKFNLYLDNKIKENIVFRYSNSDKFLLTFIKNTNKDNKYKALIKGDKENIFSYCNKYIDSDENIKEIDENYKHKINDLNKFNILLIIAEKECDTVIINENEFFKDFIIKGLFIVDNITKNISKNINRIKNCGISTLLITKDTLKNTINICEKSNLIQRKMEKLY